MFTRRYWPSRYFAPTYWAPAGYTVLVSLAPELLWRVGASPNRVARALVSSPVRYRFRYERRSITNQFLDDVTPAITGGRIEGNNDRDVFRTAEFEVDALARDSHGAPIVINPLADHIAVIMELLVDGEVWVDLPMGLFALKVPRRHREPNLNTWRVTANDLGIHLIEATTTATYTLAAGQNYITGTNGAAAILDAFGLRHALPSTGLVAPSDVTNPPGTPYMTVLKKLLGDGCNMHTPWFDRNGVARTRVRDDMSQRAPDVTYRGDDFVLATLDEEDDDTRFANQVVMVVDDPNRPPLSAVATNNDPSSPVSTVSLGRTVTKVLQSQAADQTTLDAAAVSELRQAASLYQRATVQTSIDPRREAHEVYRLHVPEVYDGALWWARSWSVELSTGAVMTHRLGRVAALAAEVA